MEFAFFALLVLYLLPWIVAMGRDHDRAGSILALTLLLGWTGVGWLASLGWAWRGSPARDREDTSEAVVLRFSAVAPHRMK